MACTPTTLPRKDLLTRHLFFANVNVVSAQMTNLTQEFAELLGEIIEEAASMKCCHVAAASDPRSG